MTVSFILFLPPIYFVCLLLMQMKGSSRTPLSILAIRCIHEQYLEKNPHFNVSSNYIPNIYLLTRLKIHVLMILKWTLIISDILDGKAVLL